MSREGAKVGLHGILARLVTSLDAHQEVTANSGLDVHIVVPRIVRQGCCKPKNNNMNAQPTVCHHLLVGIKTGEESGKYAMQSYIRNAPSRDTYATIRACVERVHGSRQVAHAHVGSSVHG